MPATRPNETPALIAKTSVMLGIILIIAGFASGIFSPTGILCSGAGFLLVAAGLIAIKKPEYILLMGW